MLKIRTQLLTTAAVVALSSAAYAADMPMKAPPPAPVAPIPSWTGFYAGLQAGLAGWDGNCSQSNTVLGAGDSIQLGIPCATNPGLGNHLSALGGGRVGYDYQFNPSIVVGVVADWNWTGLSFEDHVQGTTGGTTSNGTANASLDWLASVRGRLGWAAGNWLLYGTGGVAWAGIEFGPNSLQGTFSPFSAPQVTTTKTGWVAGGGIEYKATEHVSIFAEGLVYGGFGTVNTVAHTTSPITSTYTTSLKINDIVSGLVGVNYRF